MGWVHEPFAKRWFHNEHAEALRPGLARIICFILSIGHAQTLCLRSPFRGTGSTQCQVTEEVVMLIFLKRSQGLMQADEAVGVSNHQKNLWDSENSDRCKAYPFPGPIY
jgi:hypothetical protein